MKLIFEWDLAKAKSNSTKHKVRFEEAKEIFADPRAVTFGDDAHSEFEKRFITIGISLKNRILLVVHTEEISMGNDVIIRIISCRKATGSEREIYDEAKR